MDDLKKELIDKIENLQDQEDVQHHEYYSGYSFAINDVVELIKKFNFIGSSLQFNAYFDENNECIVDDIFKAKVIKHYEPTFLIEYNHNGQTEKVQTKRVKRPKSF